MQNNIYEQEKINFLYRIIFCIKNVLFLILNSNHLEPKKRNLLLNTIKSLANLLILEDKKMETTLVTFSTESNSDIFTALKYSYIYNNLDKGRSYDINLNNFYLIKSDSSGVGKSRHIRNLP